MRMAVFAKLPASLLLLLLLLPDGAALENGLARTPPMGTNDWNSLAVGYAPWTKWGFNASAVLATARKLVDSGLKDLGYEYVNIDCGWSSGFRDAASGALVPNATLYPGGLAALTARLRALGLKAGIYTSGTMCCGPKGADDGIVGHEAADVAQLAALGFEYLKNDDCGSTTASFDAVRDLLLARAAAGQPVVHSIHTSFTHSGHAWPVAIDPAHARAVANTFRTTKDIRNNVQTTMRLPPPLALSLTPPSSFLCLTVARRAGQSHH